jgi:2-polyprenyl-6-hydroxyphenyl methylase/3-demethylubiquinone-9 3-methyltransferase
MDAEHRFAFGENWQRFLGTVDEARVADAERSLQDMLGRGDLAGMRLLDIGSGSGLFSLAARRLGAEVLSFDYDAQSVACAEELRRRFRPGDPGWTVARGSVLDKAWLATLGRFDIVYSWGVLHHTGAMWPALANATMPLAPGGTLFIALYNDQGWISRYWHVVKRVYNTGAAGRWAMIAAHAPYLIGLRMLVRTLRRRGRIERGMTLWYDMRDWLGGLPFEVARPDEVRAFAGARGLVLARERLCGTRNGCNEFVFARHDG